MKNVRVTIRQQKRANSLAGENIPKAHLVADPSSEDATVGAKLGA
jgi:hypothetical protein